MLPEHFEISGCSARHGQARETGDEIENASRRFAGDGGTHGGRSVIRA